MLSRFHRPGSKILGFGSTIYMQKRNMWTGDDMIKAVSIGIGSLAVLSTTALYLTYKSYMYFDNNYEIVRKDKMNGKNTDLNEKNVTEEYQSTYRSGKM